MRTRREPETPEEQAAREQRQARQRNERVSADDRALDAAVKQSIKLYGP